ncbi:MAG: hypothetical protein AAF399_22270 [Bacteroidota bacterium]
MQKYVQLTRWLTLPILVLLLFPIVWWWESLSSFWLGFILLTIPLNFLGVHFLAVRLLSRMDLNKRNQAHLEVGPDFISLDRPGGEVEIFPLHQLRQIRWMYRGYEGVIWPKGKGFNGSQNQLHFQFFDRKIDVSFRLISHTHRKMLLTMLAHWYEAKIDFEEFNQTSGLAVQSRMLEV